MLDDQPGVVESAVIGVPHPDFGETPVGLLVPEPDARLDLETISAAAARARSRATSSPGG